MQPTLSKKAGAEFVAIRTARDGWYFIECFLRAPPLAPGFASEMMHIHDNNHLPMGKTFDGLIELAVSLAAPYGYTAAEIVWEE
jgi:hypothetical protein